MKPTKSSGAGSSPLRLTKARQRASGWHVEGDGVSVHDGMTRRTRSCMSASLRPVKLSGANTTSTQQHAVPRAEPVLRRGIFGNASARPEESAPLISRAPNTACFVSGGGWPIFPAFFCNSHDRGCPLLRRLCEGWDSILCASRASVHETSIIARLSGVKIPSFEIGRAHV